MSELFTFTPLLNGQPFDPVISGGAVDYLEFFADPVDRSAGTGAVASVSPGFGVGNGGQYAFTLPDSLPDGRYWLRASWRASLLDDPTYQDVGTIDYPVVNPPIVRVEELATLLKLTIPISPAQRAELEECIADAQAVVELAIGSVIPKKLVLRGAYYDETSGKDRMSALTWFITDKNIQITDWQVNQDGVTYDVTYWYGFDGRKETPIKRFIIRYAAAWWRKAFGNDSTFGQVISSVSTEGQSVSYSTKENVQDVDPSTGMSLQALIDRYGAGTTKQTVRVSQQRNLYYGEDRTHWRGDGYVWPDVWW